MEDLRIMKNDELRDIARSYVITGAWKMNKNQLIDSIIKAATLNGNTDMYFDSEAQNEPEQLQIAPESTESDELNNLSDKSEEATEQSQDASKLKQYAAWVKDRTTKELTTVVGKAESREAFYLSIKDKYRVRLITKPEKLEEECKEWEIRHARNKKMKNEKYATDKAKAKELGMSVAKYRKEVKNK